MDCTCRAIPRRGRDGRLVTGCPSGLKWRRRGEEILRQKFYILLFLALSLLASRQDRIFEQYLIASSSTGSEQERALSRLVSHGREAAVFLTNELERKNPARLEIIEKALVMIGSDAVEPLLKKLSSPNHTVAATSARLLGKIGSKDATLPLMMAMRSPCITLRANACLALGEIGDPAAVDNLASALSDPVVEVRRNAAIALGKIGDPAPLNALVDLLHDNDYSVRYSASNAIAGINDESILPILEDIISNDTTTAKYHAIDILGKISDESSIQKLLSLTESPDHLARGFSYIALSNYRGRYEIANAIKKGLHDNSPFVRTMSLKAIKLLKVPPWQRNIYDW